jgi:hypothetical protein
MGIVHKNEKFKYTARQRLREEIKFGNGVSNPYRGESLYLPRKQYYNEGQGQGIGDIINFVAQNKDLIKDVAGTVGNVVDAVGKVGTNTIDIIKKVKELKQNGISNSALEQVLKSRPREQSEQKSGSGFFYINK